MKLNRRYFLGLMASSALKPLPPLPTRPSGQFTNSLGVAGGVSGRVTYGTAFPSIAYVGDVWINPAGIVSVRRFDRWAPIDVV